MKLCMNYRLCEPFIGKYVCIYGESAQNNTVMPRQQ